MTTEQNIENAHIELLLYTLDHAGRDASFIHQHVVDAWAAQQATAHSKPIAVMFALIGLYLHVEKGYTGRAVQDAHMRLARKRKHWPRLPMPEDRGQMTVFDVLAASPGKQRDAAIDKWCRSVWRAWRDSHAVVGKLVQTYLGDAFKK